MLRRLSVSALAIYVFFILLNTLFRRDTYVGEEYNFKLFWTYFEIAKGGGRARRLIIEIITNLLMTVPIGFLLPASNEKVSLPKALLIGIFFSFSIEILQLLLHKGLCELDDVIHNTIGVALGFLINKIITYAVEKRRNKKKENTYD